MTGAMSSLFFGFIAVLLGTIGARDQLTVAQVSAVSGRGPGVLAAAAISATVSAMAMALAGRAMSGLLPAAGKTMLVAFALGFAAIELALPVRQARAREPTRSVAAIAIVLFARQLGDAARFIVFAIAAATGAPLWAGVGGALGGILALAAGWAAGEGGLAALPLRAMRLALGAIVLAAAVAVGLGARGIIG